MSDAPAPLLRVEGLSLSIGGAPILDRVSFDVARGETFGLIGESGSGKSMTALAIMRLVPDGAALSGRALFEGRDLAAASEREMCALRGAGIGMVFQEPMSALNPVRSIGDQVAESALVHRRAGRAGARAIAERALRRAGLPPERVSPARYPHELSGGQRQRAVIAIAIALGPKLLIADEPTTALDVTTQARILDLLSRLAAEDGMGLLLITHDLGIVADRADRIAVMKEGAVVEQGPAARVFSEMRHPYTRRLAAAARFAPVRPDRGAGGETPALEVRGAVRRYPGRRRGLFGREEGLSAVDGVDLVVSRGETVALVGESGCGKSTLARAILGLEPLERGEIRIAGEPARAPFAPSIRRRVQIVFQDPYGSFDPRWRVERAVAEPLHLLDDPPRGEARRARVAQALSLVGIGAEALDRYPHEFSGGQRQRLAIARALIVEPALVILDEATSALDVSIRAQVLDLLAGLSERLGVAYLFIAHDLGVVRAVADRVCVMRAGRIVESGPTARLFAQPREDYTRDLIAASPDLDAALARRAVAASC